MGARLLPSSDIHRTLYRTRTRPLTQLSSLPFPLHITNFPFVFLSYKTSKSLPVPPDLVVNEPPHVSLFINPPLSALHHDSFLWLSSGTHGAGWLAPNLQKQILESQKRGSTHWTSVTQSKLTPGEKERLNGPVLASFCCQLHTPEKRKHQLKNCLHQIVLWTCLWGILYLDC